MKECYMDLKIICRNVKQVEDMIIPLVNAIDEVAKKHGVGVAINEPHERDTTDSGDRENKSCNICGGILVKIRGRYPHTDRREICPTCVIEQLEDMLTNIHMVECQQAPTSDDAQQE
ncbi:MAG: hypothetical protein ACWGQW_02140 [bacterium]